MKLCKAIKTSFSIEHINIFYLSNLSIDINNYICQFNCFWVLDNLQLTIIRDVHDQITTSYPSYQKIVILIA